MRKIPFWKMSGAGNDFVVIDDRRKSFPATTRAIARVCDRHEGVGADGLLLLQRSDKADFRMAYFNADGSRATMCGNGARCIAAFAHAHGVVGKRFTFETGAGLVGGAIVGPLVEVTLTDALDYRPHQVLHANGKSFPLSAIHTGVPHAVVFVRRVDEVDIVAEGRALRFHKAFGSAGTNVNFVQRIDRRTLKVRTYERGVEGETLACGTGVSAAAIVGGLQGLVHSPVRCITSGGDMLEVRFDAHAQDPKRPATRVVLRGPARLTFKGEVQL